jgi:hypothetical protein
VLLLDALRLRTFARTWGTEHDDSHWSSPRDSGNKPATLTNVRDLRQTQASFAILSASVDKHSENA